MRLFGIGYTKPSPNPRRRPALPRPSINTAVDQYGQLRELGRAPQTRRRCAQGGARTPVRWRTRFLRRILRRCAGTENSGTGRVRQVQGKKWPTLLGRERLAGLA